jgi:HSP20 family protein
MKTLARTNDNGMPVISALLNDFFNEGWFDSSLSNWRSAGSTLPAVNIRENSDNFLIEVAAPGMKKENFNVELDNDVLTISSSIEGQSKEDGQYMRREFSYQSFQRSFSLPKDKVNGEKISARYVDGILTLEVPKREEAKPKPARQIRIG